MSRIRGIEAKQQKAVLQTRRNGFSENNKNKNEDQAASSKEEGEKHQIAELLARLPALASAFEVHRKVGEGTFSSVYLGSLRHQAARAPHERRLFAIKHLVPTAHPARVEHELRCLQDIGGKNNVIGVELCLRNLDTIVFVMPYIPHKKFSEYVGSMDAMELRGYMRALLAALQHVHSFGVIHRDVKPSNFLYDRDNRRYLLVDFGLAQRVCPPPPPLAAPPAPPPAHNNNVLKRARTEEEPIPRAKRAALDLSLGARAGPAPAPPVPVPVSLPAPAPPVTARRACAQARSLPTPKSPPMATAGVGGPTPCACAGVAGVCAACSARAPPRAPRAGTQGFRPPEVLLKYPYQTVAVDVWAAGVVLASVLCARYPLLRAPDDGHALAELADLLGTAPLARAAAALGRRLVVSSSRRGLCLRKLCARLRGAPPPALPAGSAAAPAGPACARCRLPSPHCLCRDDSVPATEFVPGATVAGFPDAAFALAARLLEPDPRARISAAHALDHPFLAD